MEVFYIMDIISQEKEKVDDEVITKGLDRVPSNITSLATTCE